MSDYEIDDEATCPKCGHSPTHYRDCTNFCEEGWFDESDDDPINFIPGESLEPCPECKGTSIERWCPSCGENLSGLNLWDEDEEEESYPPEIKKKVESDFNYHRNGGPNGPTGHGDTCMSDADPGL